MIELINVCKDYILTEETLRILHNINLKIKEKEFVGILGASGSGKSTLMHIMSLLDTPTCGEIILNGKNISLFKDNQLSSIRNEYMGFIFQQFNLINNLTVLENILLPIMYAKKHLDYDPKQKAFELLEKFKIFDRKDFHPNKISGGQQQRVAIARALIMNPKIIFADEPTGNLDSKTGDEILNLLENLNQELDVTVIIVTHEKEVVLRTKRQIYIKDGTIVKKYL